jgi:hypothetical protein
VDNPSALQAHQTHQPYDPVKAVPNIQPPDQAAAWRSRPEWRDSTIATYSLVIVPAP